MNRPRIDPGAPAGPRSQALDALERSLHDFDHPAAAGGRLLVFRAAERVAARFLEDRGEAGEVERVRGACMELLSTVAAILELQRARADWPIDHVLQDVALAIGGVLDLDVRGLRV